MPGTFLVLLMAVVLVLAGVLIIIGALKPARPGQECRAEGCGHRNPPEARYCAQCGARLGVREDVAHGPDG